MYNYIVTETDWNHWVNGWMGDFFSNFDEGKMEEMWYSIIPASHQTVTFSLSNVGLYIVQVWWTMLLEIAQHWDTCEGSVIISQRIDLDWDTSAQHPFVFDTWQMLTGCCGFMTFEVLFDSPSKFLRWCLKIIDHTGLASVRACPGFAQVVLPCTPQGIILMIIFCGDIPLHRPYIGLIYGRHLQFRFLKWLVIICKVIAKTPCFLERVWTLFVSLLAPGSMNIWTISWIRLVDHYESDYVLFQLKGRCPVDLCQTNSGCAIIFVP